MTLEYVLTRGDLFALNLSHQFRRPVVWIAMAVLASYLTGVILYFPGVGGVNLSFWQTVFLIAPSTILLYGGLIMLVSWIRVGRKGFVAMTGPRRITLTQEEIASESKDSSGTLRWSAVQKIVRTSSHLLIYVTPMNAFIIPKREFTNPGEFETLHHQVCQWWKEAEKTKDQ